MSCGHLHVYHHKGMPEEYEVRQGPCLFCEIDRLTARVAELEAGAKFWSPVYKVVLDERDRLRAALENALCPTCGKSVIVKDAPTVCSNPIHFAGAADETTDGKCGVFLPPAIRCWKPRGHTGEHENGGWHW